MKTVYIPAGATYNYETLVTDDVIVHGHLHVTNGLKAKHISGRGFITAGEVSADKEVIHAGKADKTRRKSET